MRGKERSHSVSVPPRQRRVRCPRRSARSTLTITSSRRARKSSLRSRSVVVGAVQTLCRSEPREKIFFFSASLNMRGRCFSLRSSSASAAARSRMGINTSTVHRWLNDGFIAGEQITPGAPWRIRITDELRARFVEQAPPDYRPMLEATMKLGVSRQTVLQRVKRGELDALLVTRGRRKGLRVKVVDDQPGLFHE